MTFAASRPGVEALAEAAVRALREGLGTAPSWIVAAPGRVNLIGEHTDYSAGFVLPMAIERSVVIAAGPAAGNRLHLASATTGEAVEIPLDEPARAGAPRWSSYVRGVLAGYQRRGARLPSMNAWLVSDVPMGSGLASSAALEVAVATLLEVASGTKLPPVEKARLCQRAEHEFAGVPCGLMDQLSATLGDENGPLLIDCRTEIVRSVPFPHTALRVVVANTNVPRSLGAGAYAQRYAECESAARCLGVASLREATLPMVDAAAQALGPVLHRRARHVVTENARTLDAARALEERDLQRLGALLYESHASLRDDYEVSTPELDALVECARKMGEPGGVLGARMNGAGFGGCTVTLVHAARALALCEELQREYEHRTGRVLDVFVSRPARGARVLDATSLG